MFRSRLTISFTVALGTIGLFVEPPLASSGAAVLCPKALDIAEQSAKTGWQKPLPFPTIDPLVQDGFEATLTFIARLPIRFRPDQCYKSCVGFSHAAMLNFFAPASQTSPFSGGYLTARTFEIKFIDSILHADKIVVETTHQTRHAVLRFGLMTESDFRSDSNVDTKELAFRLNNIADEYRPLIRRSLPAEREALGAEAMAVARKAIQAFFGPYPSARDLEARGALLPNDLWSSIVNAEGVRREYFHVSDYDSFSAIVPFLLGKGIPILLAYRHHEGMITADGRQDIPTGVRLNSVGAGNHSALVTGLARTTKDRRLYYQILNTHLNASTLYLSEEYLSKSFRTAEFLLTDEQRSDYSAAGGGRLYLPAY